MMLKFSDWNVILSLGGIVSNCEWPCDCRIPAVFLGQYFILAAA